MKSRNKKAISKRPDRADKKGRSLLYITGDSPLVEEYAELCMSKGYEVLVQFNSPVDGKKKKRFKQSNIIPSKTSLALELTTADLAVKRKNLERLDKALPTTSALLSVSIAVTATEQSGWIHRKHRLVGFGALPGFTDRSLVEVAPTVFSPPETLEVVNIFFRSLGKDIEIVQDRVGMVLPRIICQIINESIFALQDDVATPADIDTAMKLGVNYPQGPVEWADRIGFKNVYAVLSALHDDMLEDRYRAAPLLKQMAESGEWWNKAGNTR